MSDSYDPLIHKLVYGTDDERKFICENRIDLFALTYFSEYFQYPMAPYHLDFFEDGKAMEDNTLNEALWIAYRESAKTTDAKIILAHMICFKKKGYVLWGSYDKENSEAALFDVTVSLQTNPKLLHDFGQLYNEIRGDEEKKLKRLSSFITANDIKIEAISTQESTRGRVYKNQRPDAYFYDDIENSKTKTSVPVTRKIVRHVDEARAGMAPNGSLLILGNYISETGVINHFQEVIGQNPKGVVRRIDAVMRGVPAWPGKYVMTDQEAASTGKVSLETVKRKLGSIVWQEEMMNSPAGTAEPFFDRRKIDKDIEKVRDPIENNGGFRIYKEFNPMHRYGAGADTSMGIGLDSCSSVFIDFSRTPNLVVGSYDNNRIAPNLFAHELKREGDIFGKCIIAPENNNESGGACLNEFKNIYDNIYMTRSAGKMYDTETKKVGWKTTSSSKADMLFGFKSEYEDGNVEIWDIKLLKEMRSFTLLDMRNDDADTETTRHFDLLIAACIANKMREHAILVKPKKKTVQRPYESPSIEVESTQGEFNPTRRQTLTRDYEGSGL